MKHINITSGEYLNSYLKNKYDDVFIPFNEAMIQGDLLYPLFDDDFINNRTLTHNITRKVYLEKLQEFLNIKNYISELETITLWFGKDAFCIINLITVLAYLEELNYKKDIIVNLVDDYSCEILESNIRVELKVFKDLYLSLINRELIKTNIDFIDEDVKDYLYITSDNNFVIEYIKDNKDKISKEELLINLMKQTYKYDLSDLFILSLIDKESEKAK
jgi:hypothetical protein